LGTILLFALCPGFRRVDRRVNPKYANYVTVRTYPSGERRLGKAPPRDLVTDAFDEFGTQAAVASAFGVSRGTVKRWAQEYGLQLESHPEAGLASFMKRRLTSDIDKRTISQWLMDEGSVSVTYFAKGDYTILLVCGSMNDYAVLSSISRILDVPITSSKAPGQSTLPMGSLRVQSARAYVLLEIILPHLVGLKAKEAEAALKFFPPTGLLRGRHTTEEFLLNVWKEFAIDSFHEWNMRRRVKIREGEIIARVHKWVEGRVKRARRFRDAKEHRHGATGSVSAFHSGWSR
jgi:hypothetical protein